MRRKYKSESQNSWGQKGLLEVVLSNVYAQSQLISCKVPRAVYGWFFNLPDGDCTALLSSLLQYLTTYRKKSLDRVLYISAVLKSVSSLYTFPSGILYTLIRFPWALCSPCWTVTALSPHMTEAPPLHHLCVSAMLSPISPCVSCHQGPRTARTQMCPTSVEQRGKIICLDLLSSFSSQCCWQPRGLQEHIIGSHSSSCPPEPQGHSLQTCFPTRQPLV